MGTKIHAAVSGLGLPVKLLLTAGQEADIRQGEKLIEGVPFEVVIGDKGYDSKKLVRLIRAGVRVLCWLTFRPVTAKLFGRGFEEAQDVRKDIGDVERLPHGELTGPRSYCLVGGVSEVVQRLCQPGLLRL